MEYEPTNPSISILPRKDENQASKPREQTNPPGHARGVQIKKKRNISLGLANLNNTHLLPIFRRNFKSALVFATIVRISKGTSNIFTIRQDLESSSISFYTCDKLYKTNDSEKLTERGGGVTHITRLGRRNKNKGDGA